MNGEHEIKVAALNAAQRAMEVSRDTRSMPITPGEVLAEAKRIHAWLVEVNAPTEAPQDHQ